MGIDRIGKGGAPPPAAPNAPAGAKEGVTPTERASRPFEVRPERSAEVAPAHAVAPAQASPLERLRAGEIDLNGYLDLKVEQATAHLRGLSAAQLDEIRATLRVQVANDPALVDLVRTATGRTPTSEG